MIRPEPTTQLIALTSCCRCPAVQSISMKHVVRIPAVLSRRALVSDRRGMTEADHRSAAKLP